MQLFDPNRAGPTPVRLSAAPRHLTNAPQTVAPLHGRYRIMVVDDMSVSRGVIAQSLEILDCKRVVVAADAKSALASLQASPVDLVLCDYLMPGMTGLELLDRIRRSPDLAQIRFVLVTGATEPGLERKAAALGVCAILWKPYGIRDLRALIEKVMARGIPIRRSGARSLG